jgi:hypothetical protein
MSEGRSKDTTIKLVFHGRQLHRLTFPRALKHKLYRAFCHAGLRKVVYVDADEDICPILSQEDVDECFLAEPGVPKFFVHGTTTDLAGVELVQRFRMQLKAEMKRARATVDTPIAAATGGNAAATSPSPSSPSSSSLGADNGYGGVSMSDLSDAKSSHSREHLRGVDSMMAEQLEKQLLGVNSGAVLRDVGIVSRLHTHSHKGSASARTSALFPTPSSSSFSSTATTNTTTSPNAQGNGPCTDEKNAALRDISIPIDANSLSSPFVGVVLQHIQTELAHFEDYYYSMLAIFNCQVRVCM